MRCVHDGQTDFSFQISRAMSQSPNSQFILPNDTGICVLDCKTAFGGLTSKEKLYAHYISQASWYGSLICLYQVWFSFNNSLINVHINLTKEKILVACDIRCHLYFEIE